MNREVDARDRLVEETRQVIACALQVHNTLGHGLLEKPYERAITVELAERGIRFAQQPRYPVVYKGVGVGEFVPDLVVFDRVVVDTKVVDRLSDQERGQVLNYLRISGLKVGLLLNFRWPKLEFRRVVL